MESIHNPLGAACVLTTVECQTSLQLEPEYVVFVMEGDSSQSYAYASGHTLHTF